MTVDRRQDFAEALQQLAVYPPGREELLKDPAVAQALHEVAERAPTGRPRASTLSFCRFPRPPGLLQIARLRFTSKLVTYRTQGVILMDVLEGAALLLYVAYIVWRYTSAQYRLQPLVALQVRVKGGESGRGDAALIAEFLRSSAQ